MLAICEQLYSFNVFNWKDPTHYVGYMDAKKKYKTTFFSLAKMQNILWLHPLRHENV